MLVEQVDDSYDSHNIRQGILLTSKATTMPSFPSSLLSILIVLSSALKKGLGHRNDQHEQTKEKNL